MAVYSADNMDPAVHKEMEATHKGHYKPKARDWMTQFEVLQELQKHAHPAEENVSSLRREVRKIATSAKLSLPGVNASALQIKDDESILSTKSRAEETISRHLPVEPFDWLHGRCYGCNGRHLYERDDVVTCPNADRLGCKKNAIKNRKLFIPCERRDQGRSRFEGEERKAEFGNMSAVRFKNWYVINNKDGRSCSLDI